MGHLPLQDQIPASARIQHLHVLLLQNPAAKLVVLRRKLQTGQDDLQSEPGCCYRAGSAAVGGRAQSS